MAQHDCDVALITQGQSVTTPLASRLLRLVQGDAPRARDTATPLGRIAAIALGSSGSWQQ